MISLLVVFGLFHGLLFLPVMLSIFGGHNVKDGGDDDMDHPQIPNQMSHDLQKMDPNVGNGSANPGFQEDKSAWYVLTNQKIQEHTV